MTPRETDELYEKVKTLNELIWERKANRAAVELWLNNFTGESMPIGEERDHALYLLTKFLYLGQREVNELLRTMFQTLFQHRLLVKVRSGLPDRGDFSAIHQGFLEELENTRFLGIGSPSESGQHLLYPFRQVNGLSVSYFPNLVDLCTGPLYVRTSRWAFPEVHRLVFIDDFCGTGDQAAGFGNQYVAQLRSVALRSNIRIKVWYLALMATSAGLSHIRRFGVFDRVAAVSELDTSYRVFANDSQFYRRPPSGITRWASATIAQHYGRCLYPNHPLGFDNSQLMVGFQHNVPDNTLPIFWQDQAPPWYAIFPRRAKF